MEPKNVTDIARSNNTETAPSSGTARCRVSLVIPTLNEEHRLPQLLDRLDRQTRRPDELIIADAHSSDGTRAIAAAHGARVVDGGMPGPGRNAGARAATGDIIVFMDADAEPTPDLLEKAIDEFELRGLAAASAPLRASEGETFEVDFWCAVAEGYIRAMQKLAPHAVGLFIVVRREVHESIGGFDESVVLAEDHDYVRRASKMGQYGILRGVKVCTSMRRVHHEGRWRILRIFWFSEMRTLRGIPIREIPFPYEFGVFVPDTQPYTFSDGVRAFLRIISKPSTERQTDALFAAAGSILLGALGAGTLGLMRDPLAATLFALVCAVAAAVSAWVAMRKLKFERHYGAFFMASVAISDMDIYDDAGRLIVRRGVDEICELHNIGSLDRMAELNRQGTSGILTLAREMLDGVAAFAADIGDPFYEDVIYVTGYSNLTGTLFKMGFDEIKRPPRLDFINRWYKPIMTRHLAKKMGRDLNDDVGDYRMAIATKEFVARELPLSVDKQMTRVMRSLERLERSGRVATPSTVASRNDAVARPESAE